MMRVFYMVMFLLSLVFSALYLTSDQWQKATFYLVLSYMNYSWAREEK